MSAGTSRRRGGGGGEAAQGAHGASSANGVHGASGAGADVEVLPRRLWWLGIAFVVWCLALVVLYALHAIGCAFGWSAASLRWTLVLVFLAHLAAIGWIWRRFARSQPTAPAGRTAAFVQDAIVWTAIAAFASTVLALGPPLLLTACI